MAELPLWEIISPMGFSHQNIEPIDRHKPVKVISNSIESLDTLAKYGGNVQNFTH